jgi:OOP family OmpA-OmpF porin
MRRLSLALAVAALGMSSAAMAQGYNGWYLGARGGVTWLDDQSFAISPSAGGGSFGVDYERGWGLSGNVGYQFGGPFRLELEVAYRTNDVDGVTTSAGTRLPGSTGGMNSLAAMVNGLFDFEMGWGLTPYVGLGLGYARVTADGISATGLGGSVDDDDNKFAYQAIAGLSYWFSPAVALTADYRYFATQDPKFGVSGGSVETEYKTHNVMVGLTFRFPEPAPLRPMPVAAPPPPPAPVVAPPPPPPPAAPRTYLVFFDFDRSDITPEAARIIRQAADDAKRGNVRLIVATGHADRSGPVPYNQRLSERRAAAVKAALVREGVAENTIQTAGRGENENLVPTADGVREPRNRRVEIVFR